MSNEQDNRRSFRVNESVYLKYDVISDQQFYDGIDQHRLQLGVDDGAQAKLIDLDARIIEALHRVFAENERAGKVMELLNDKIGLIADQMPGLRKSKSDLLRTSPQVCDVGADGLVFAASEQLPIGTKLYLRFLLSSDNRYVETFCSVVRDTKPPSGAGNSELPYGAAVEFHGMKPSQREILIQHMFSLESETLRMRRLQLDNADA
jgi:hypothetical protein